MALAELRRVPGEGWVGAGSSCQRGTPEDDLPAEARPGVAYIRITPKKYISWDYSRES